MRIPAKEAAPAFLLLWFPPPKEHCTSGKTPFFQEFRPDLSPSASYFRQPSPKAADTSTSHCRLTVSPQDACCDTVSFYPRNDSIGFVKFFLFSSLHPVPFAVLRHNYRCLGRCRLCRHLCFLLWAFRLHSFFTFQCTIFFRFLFTFGDFVSSGFASSFFAPFVT